MNILVRRFNSIPTSQQDTKLIRKIKDLILQGLHVEALHLYKNQLHLHVNTFTPVIPSVIKACSLSQTHHGFGLQLHSHSLKLGFDSESVISNSIISFYAKNHDIKSARKLFDEMPQRDSISWNSMINCYTQNGNCLESLQMFKKMYECGFVAKPELIASILSVCVQRQCTKSGKMIHALSIVDERFENSVFLSTALLDLYLRSGKSRMAFHVFDSMEDKNEVSWTSMIQGYVGIHDSNMAINSFRKMQIKGIKPNIVTLISILHISVELNLNTIKSIHGYAFRHGFHSDIRISSSLIHLYSSHTSSLPLIDLIFEKSTQRDLILWTSIISAYSHHKQTAKNSISLFNKMQKEKFHPNSITLLGILNACTNIPSITSGIGIHGYIIKTGFNSNISITNSLINMYSKCGSLKDSLKVFQETPTPDHVSWSVIINAYGIHGYGEKALEIFKEMKEKGIEHDSITLVSVLSACNHSGLVEEGDRIFSEVKNDGKLINLEHYACYIDLLGRSGKVEKASEVMRKMGMKPSVKIMSSLVSNCRIHGRLDVAENMLSWFIELESDDAANYVLLSMIYAEFGKWLNVEGVWRDIKLRGLKKSCGFSRVET
ncbi:pentatricopeptide repeat-containing protein At4g31070, mitochondrial [Lactuca sativa]|uniref:pentatricopeptide repeat-containing protein At4g31070, mitochondrial n=1 Tax=Lactuca sativa TaxID=4236 RepID=UPI000CB956E2|nr:pentatricopeptide repeat-containing protein At4g31070, mitochondrial [Lactuca sativa]